MLVSIITVNYNNSTGLEKTIQSIINQNYQDVEYIIIDGGSTDGSVDVIKKYQKNIAYYISERDKGVYNAMNKGIAKTNGAYILFINSGDYLVSKDVVSEMMKGETGNIDLLYGNLERTFKDGKKDFVAMPSKLDAIFLLDASLCHPVTFISKRLFHKYGFYDESFKIVADWAFFVKVLLNGDATFKHKPISVAMFYMDGMSAWLSSQTIIENERKKAIDLYLSPLVQKALNDLKYYKKKYKKIYYALGLFVENGFKKIFKKTNKSFILLFQCIYLATFFHWRSFYTSYIIKKQKKKLLAYCYTIPIIINNRNRLTYLKQLIDGLEKRGYKNIFIIDNASNYLPLLTYYETLPYKVFKLKKNIGHYALWDTDIYNQFKNNYYVYTDSDVSLVEDCPSDFMFLFYTLLNKYPKLGKVGFSLKINDLPSHYKFKNEVLDWEGKFYNNRREKLAYKAPIDTTFALYAPHSFKGKHMFKALRTAYPYEMRHLPWYENQMELTDEQKYYYRNIETAAHWSGLVSKDL